VSHTQTREKQKYETIFRLSGAKKEQHSSSKKEGGRDDIFLMGGRPSLSIFFFFLYMPGKIGKKKKEGRKSDSPQRGQSVDRTSLRLFLVWTNGEPKAVKLLGPQWAAKTR
jgi:hypothetical protein